ncbi:tetratricopeptide repeat protein [Desulforegula conservatrix]|uniref:tetratricopeptide repeat protein n=1 Tax=Desulforegula conservatrix TaxID=153026 RepID=UPI000486FA50|nr:tetratricopeptide repeat protein [Desulforegula conservatrix]
MNTKAFINKTFRIILPFCFILFLFSTAYSAENHSGRIIDLKGEVQIIQQNGASESPSPGRMLFNGDCLKTGQTGWAAVLMSDETLIQVSRNSVFVIKGVASRAGWFGSGANSSGPSNSSEYKLDSGKVWMRNKNKNVPIDIETPSVTAAIRGTELNLQVSEEKATLITVLSGRVGCRNDFGTVIGERKQQIGIKYGEAPAITSIITPEDAVQWTVTIPVISGPMDMPLSGKSFSAIKNEEASLEEMLRSDSKNTGLKLRLAEIKRDLGKSMEAEKLFKECISTNFDEKNSPSVKRAFKGLGWTYLDRNRNREAQDSFLRADSNEKMVILGLSETYSRLNKPQEASKINEKGEVQFPESPEFKLQKAFFEIKNREPQKAEIILKQLTQKSPDYSLAWSALSLVSLYKGDKDSALLYSEKAISLKPESPTPYIIKSYAHQAAFDLDSAKKSTEMALEHDPANTLALVNLSKLLFGSDHTEEAMETINKAEDSNPENGEVHSTKGFILLALRRTDEASESFKKAIFADRSIGESYLGYALAMMRQGDADTALQYISAAIALEPRRSLFVSYWGKMLYEIKRFDRAIEVLELASSLDPKDPTPDLYRALILNDLNKPTEAIEAVNRSIKLNDNKAVYNSRFILDRDLAVKSVGLAYLYNRLGLSDWGTNKALASIKQDYTNYAAHFFYGNGVFRDGDMSRVYTSETLLGKLLQPANVNSYNSFNNYTSFFEKPDAEATLSGSLGSHNTASGSAIVSGSAPETGVAFSASATRNITEGWKGTNNAESNGASGIAKWNPTINDGIMLYGADIESRKEDNMTAYSYDAKSDPYDRNKNTFKNFESGYHHHFGPGTDFLLYFNKTVNDDRSRYHDSFPPFNVENPYPPPEYVPVTMHILGNDTNDIPASQLQGQLHYSRGNHQLMTGALKWWQDRELKSSYTDYYLLYDETIIDAVDGQAGGKTENSFNSFYLRDIWNPAPGFVIDAAAYFDVMESANPYNKAKTDLTEFNPRFGITWNPAPAHTFRIAAFRYLLPWFLNRIDPLEVAGIPIFRNADPGSITKEADLAYEFEWGSGFAGINLFTINKETEYKGYDSAEILRSYTDEGDSNGFRLTLNQLLWKGMGVSSYYSYADTEDDNKPSAARRDHRITAKLSGVHDSGVFGSVAQTFRYEDRKFAGLEDEEIWLTDAEIGVELKDKKGVIRFQVLNIFDNHFDWITDLYVSAGRVPTTEFLLTTSLNF